MKVAMIGLRGIPSKDGGVEVAVGELAPLLVKKGLDLTVYCRSNYCDHKISEFRGVKLIYYPALQSKHFEAFVHTLNLNSTVDWREYCQSAHKPEDIPTNPQNTYKNIAIYV